MSAYHHLEDDLVCSEVGIGTAPVGSLPSERVRGCSLSPFAFFTLQNIVSNLVSKAIWLILPKPANHLIKLVPPDWIEQSTPSLPMTGIAI